jgi:hypothetical protein
MKTLLIAFVAVLLLVGGITIKSCKTSHHTWCAPAFPPILTQGAVFLRLFSMDPRKLIYLLFKWGVAWTGRPCPYAYIEAGAARQTCRSRGSKC